MEVEDGRSLEEITHDIVNTAMAIDLRLGVLELRDSSVGVSATRNVTRELLTLIRELEGVVTSGPSL